jgi:hypothetical protein
MLASPAMHTSPRRSPRAAALGLGRLATTLLAAASLAAPALHAQGSWPTTHQQATWVVLTVDEPVTKRAALWFDANWRRMGFGEEPQQLLLRPGVLFTLAPGVRAGGGYAYIATAPYGELPTETPLREHRLWQQVNLSHPAGRFTISHRYRWEQRWIAKLTDGETGEFGYQQRARYLIRAQRPLSADAQPRIGFVSNEILLPVGHNESAGRFAQNRFAVGLGIPMGEGRRLEVGYMNLWNALPARSANEVNHTLVLTYALTGR